MINTTSRDRQATVNAICVCLDAAKAKGVKPFSIKCGFFEKRDIGEHHFNGVPLRVTQLEDGIRVRCEVK